MYETYDGYEQIRDFDTDLVSWEFYMLRVIKRIEDGKYFWATDSGCSCPEPFENHMVSDFLPLREDWDAFERVVREASDLDTIDTLKEARGWLKDESVVQG